MLLYDYVKSAQAHGKAIGHFNVSTIDAVWAIVDAARALGEPVIIGVSEGERSFIGLRQAVALVRSIRDEFKHPIFINADHTYSFDGVAAAVDAGCDSVIFDGAKLPFEENMRITAQCVDYARSVNPCILVEAELGYIGTSSELLTEVPKGVSPATMTAPEEARRFVEETGVDLFAPSVGNVHGIVEGVGNPALDTARIAAIRDAVGVPLVLHGGSGITDAGMRSAIAAGISIVHVNTEIRKAWRDALERSLQEQKTVAPYKLLIPAREAVERVVNEKVCVFAGR